MLVPLQIFQVDLELSFKDFCVYDCDLCEILYLSADEKFPDVFIAYLGDLCLNGTSCLQQVTNSECADAGDNAGTMRCRCSANYYAYNDQSTSDKKDYKCGMQSACCSVI